MLKVFQNKSDNCFQACIASILELPLEDVPHLFADCGRDSMWTQPQWDKLREFTRSKGYQAGYAECPEDLEIAEKLKSSELHYVAFGKGSNSQFGHCVVMHSGEYMHDPLPGGNYLEGDPWLLVFFVELADEQVELADEQ